MTFRVVAASLPVPISIPLFAAIDVCDRVTWTDDPFHAVEFDTRADAEDFCRERIGGSDWLVKPKS